MMMGSAPMSPAGPHTAVAEAFTVVWEGRPSTGANSRLTGALYVTLTLPVEACSMQPCMVNPSLVALTSLSMANESACGRAWLGVCSAQDCAAARAPASEPATMRRRIVSIPPTSTTRTAMPSSAIMLITTMAATAPRSSWRSRMRSVIRIGTLP